MDAQEILEHLDDCQGVLPFLGNDGRQHLADARLTVFRSPEKWAVFMEMPYHCVLSGGWERWLGGVGNCLVDEDWTHGESINQDSLLEEVPDAPLWAEGIGNAPWLGDRAEFSVLFKGERLDFRPSSRDYEAAGIVFENDAKGPGSLDPGLLFRFLCHHLDHPFFASESELRSLIEDTPDLEIFLQTRDWHHPVVLCDEAHKRPQFGDTFFEADFIANIPGFQILARAIASGDLTEWNNQGSSTFNTHWESLEAIRHENLIR